MQIPKKNEKYFTGFLAAVQFLTLLPVKRNFTAEQVGRSTVYFPVVGLIIGLILAGFNWIVTLILPSSIVNVLLIALLALLTGGLHLDGAVDTFDGIAGHRTPEQRLEIMRDSRIGGFGAIGLALLLLLEYVSLNSIPGNWKWELLILAPVLSRWAMVNAIFVYPYARPFGLGRSFKDAVNPDQFAIATVIALVLSIALFRVAGIAIMAGCWLLITLTALYLKKQLNGLTGDTYGAINEIGMLSVLLMTAMLTYNQWLL